MAAYPQPTDEDVEMFGMTVPGMNRMEVILRLKGNNNNVQQAVNEYFDDLDNPRGNKYQWDETQFSTDREGGQTNHGISFKIHASDDPGPYGHFDGGQSRPPSRTSNNKSPLHNVIDLTAEQALADPRNSGTHDEQGDRELEQALAASRAEAGLPPQQSGVTSTDQVYFGPANRNQYEQGKWDMVPVGKSSAQEIMLDPEPEDRKREPDTPAFLKPSIDGSRLGAILTIYHEIPLMREIFLDRIDVIANYGHDKLWWTGKVIELPVIEDGEEADYEDYDLEFTQELQRLMAFLDMTDRSYGSSEALANLRAVKKWQRRGLGLDLESAVFHAWRKAFGEQAVVKKVFSQGVSSDVDEEKETKEFAILDLALPSKTSGQETLYDIADAVLWPYPEHLDLSSSAYLSHIGDAIAFRLEGDESSKGIEVPAVWYPDRYLKSGREAALKMRAQKFDIEERIGTITALEESLTNFPMRGGKLVKVQDLFKASLQHDLSQIQDDAGNGHVLDLEKSEVTSEQNIGLKVDLSAQLRKVMASIDQKLLALKTEKEKARAMLRELSKLYTEPSNGPGEPQLHKYTLRGVSTTKNTTYICRRSEPDLIEMDIDAAGNGGVDLDQWWRINYTASVPNPITVEKTTEERVLEAAKNESKNSILVYASEKALNWAVKPLPSALETFVRNDNLAFKAECLEYHGSPVQVTSPKSPGKRKYDDRSEESMDSVRWDGGASPKGHETTVNILERELVGNEDSDWEGIRTASQNLSTHLAGPSGTSNGYERHEVIMGLDPAEQHSDDEGQSSGQEMQERDNFHTLTNPRKYSTTQKSNTIDNMDFDQAMHGEGGRVEQSSGLDSPGKEHYL